MIDDGEAVEPGMIHECLLADHLHHQPRRQAQGAIYSGDLISDNMKWQGQRELHTLRPFQTQGVRLDSQLVEYRLMNESEAHGLDVVLSSLTMI